MEIRKSSFYPVDTLDGKSNYKPVFYIDQDGSIIERIHLNIPDPSERELVVCLHYLRHIGRHFHDEKVGVNILKRDDPWDFSLELNTGVTLNVEITSIADMQKHFKINKNEERFENWKSKAKIPLHELEKLNRILPSQDLTEKIRKFKEMNVSENDSVDNPLYKSGKSILISNMPKTATDLYSLLKDAIAKKVSKKHPDKDRTVLIIDNRTSIFETSDYRDAAEKLATYCASSPFPEIWFYTGYYSDMNGNNAEFSFAPLKVTEQQQDVLRRMAATAEVDEHGKLVW